MVIHSVPRSKKLFMGVEIPNEVSVCAPQIGLVEDIIKQF